MPQRFRVYDGSYPHFITSSIVYWIPVFSRDDYFQILADSLAYCVEHKGLAVHGYVIMPNHFHLICSQADGAISAVIRDMKSFTSRSIAAKLFQDGRKTWLAAMSSPRIARSAEAKVWKDEFHPEEVRTERFFLQKLEYMHNNPVRAGYVDDPSEWKYSSAGFYYKQKEPIVQVAPLMW